MVVGRLQLHIDRGGVNDLLGESTNGDRSIEYVIVPQLSKKHGKARKNLPSIPAPGLGLFGQGPLQGGIMPGHTSFGLPPVQCSNWVGKERKKAAAGSTITYRLHRSLLGSVS